MGTGAFDTGQESLSELISETATAEPGIGHGSARFDDAVGDEYRTPMGNDFAVFIDGDLAHTFAGGDRGGDALVEVQIGERIGPSVTPVDTASERGGVGGFDRPYGHRCIDLGAVVGEYFEFGVINEFVVTDGGDSHDTRVSCAVGPAGGTGGQTDVDE